MSRTMEQKARPVRNVIELSDGHEWAYNPHDRSSLPWREVGRCGSFDAPFLRWYQSLTKADRAKITAVRKRVKRADALQLAWLSQHDEGEIDDESNV